MCPITTLHPLAHSPVQQLSDTAASILQLMYNPDLELHVESFFGLLHILEQRQNLILQLMLYSRIVGLLQLIYVQSQQKPGLLTPFHSLVMGILPQILLRV
jgi:hypothetical protein